MSKETFREEHYEVEGNIQGWMTVGTFHSEEEASEWCRLKFETGIPLRIIRCTTLREVVEP